MALVWASSFVAISCLFAFNSASATSLAAIFSACWFFAASTAALASATCASHLAFSCTKTSRIIVIMVLWSGWRSSFGVFSAASATATNMQRQLSGPGTTVFSFVRALSTVAKFLSKGLATLAFLLLEDLAWVLAARLLAGMAELNWSKGL